MRYFFFILLAVTITTFSQFKFTINMEPGLPKFNKLLIMHSDDLYLNNAYPPYKSTAFNGPLKDGFTFETKLDKNKTYNVYILDTITKLTELRRFIFKFAVKHNSNLKLSKAEVEIAQPMFRPPIVTYSKCEGCYKANVSINNLSSAPIFNCAYRCGNDIDWQFSILYAPLDHIVMPKQDYKKEIERFCVFNTDHEVVDFSFKISDHGIFKEVIVKEVKAYQDPKFTITEEKGVFKASVVYLSQRTKKEAIEQLVLTESKPVYYEIEPAPLMSEKLEMIVDEKATHPLGAIQFIKEQFNTKYATTLEGLNAKFKIVLTINSQGNVVDTKIIDVKKFDIADYNTGKTNGYVDEIKRILLLLDEKGKWNPAKKGGKSVMSKTSLELVFTSSK